MKNDCYIFLKVTRVMKDHLLCVLITYCYTSGNNI